MLTITKIDLSFLSRRLYTNKFFQLLCPNQKLLYVFLDAEVLVLTAWGRYIWMKKKTHNHRLLWKGRICTLMSHETSRNVEILQT